MEKRWWARIPTNGSRPPEKGSMTLEEILDGRKAVGYRWILKGRRTMMVSITIKKARPVAKMFSDKFKELTTVRLSHS